MADRAESLNAVCPYYTMFPLSFPLAVLGRNGASNGSVIDPFCGRGTTLFAARLLGHPAFGIDSSPVAAALAKAKLSSAMAVEVVELASDLLASYSDPAIPSGEFWSLAFHSETLAQICSLREGLIETGDIDVANLLRAILLGALHGPRTKHVASHLSNQAPRTFGPKPAYSVRYWKRHGLTPPLVDVLDVVRRRAQRYLSDLPAPIHGAAILGDSRLEESLPPGMARGGMVITSPPYFGMRTYIPDQWIRMWFLGGPEDVEYQQTGSQLSHESADAFASQLRDVWRNMSLATVPDAKMVIRFGGIHDRNADPRSVLKNSLSDSGWRLVTTRPSPDIGQGKRQVTQFGGAPNKAVAEVDYYCRRA